jgi:dihydrofolate reductase
MGRITVSEFVSLDGVMEAPGGEPGYPHSGWVLKSFDQEWLEHKLAELMAHESHLLGRITFESFADAWPSRDGPMADKINAMPKYVASTTLKNPSWNNSHVLLGDTVKAVQNLKSSLKGDMLVAGSRTLVQTLKAHNLVDEYRLMIFPIVLGSGQRLFGQTPDTLELSFLSSKTFKNGVTELCYRPNSKSPEPVRALEQIVKT